LLEEALQPRDDTEELRTWQDAKGLRTNGGEKGIRKKTGGLIAVGMAVPSV